MRPERWQQIERLHHAALARDERDRAVYLREACAGDDALRQETVTWLRHVAAICNLLQPNRRELLDLLRVAHSLLKLSSGGANQPEDFAGAEANAKREGHGVAAGGGGYHLSQKRCYNEP